MNAERLDKIREILQTKPFVSLHELEKLFPNVSSMTLRRDIVYLEEMRVAIKVRGGVRSMKFITTSMEDNFSLRMSENIRGKDEIALVASRMIETGRSIFLDSGTTILRLASIMPDERINITTTGPNVAMELSKKSLPMVNLVGGLVNRDNISISGNQALKFLADVNIDIAFIVPSGLSSGTGFTCGNYTECELKRTVIEKARKTVILMDSTKIDKSLPYTFVRPEEVDVIISDKDLPFDITRSAVKNHVKVIITEDEFSGK